MAENKVIFFQVEEMLGPNVPSLIKVIRAPDDIDKGHKYCFLIVHGIIIDSMDGITR